MMAIDQSIGLESLRELVAQVVAAEHQQLRELGCPVRTSQVHEILTGERQPKPKWPRRRQRALRERVRHALLTLLHIERAERYVDRAPALAAYHALVAGLAAGDLLLRKTQQTSGQGRGRQTLSDSEIVNAKIAKALRDYQISELAQDEYSEAAFVATKVNLSVKRASRRITTVKAKKRVNEGR